MANPVSSHLRRLGQGPRHLQDQPAPPHPGTKQHAILLTGGNAADITAAATLVSAVTPPGELVGDKGYDANHLRRYLAERGTAAVIPSTSSRKLAIPHDAERYKLRNVIERTFCRIKDFRGIATRYDKTARNFLAAVCLVAAITYWA
jgi:transposase